MRLDIDGRFIQFAFRHVRLLGDPLPGGHRPELLLASGVKAVTTCALIVMKSDEPGGLEFEASPIQFVALGNAICTPEDTFSRREGRRRAFANAVNHCGALRDSKQALFAAYLRLDPERVYIRKEKRDLFPDEKKELWAAGWEKRQERLAARAGTQRAAG